jgi:hypothetical protein
MFAFMVSKAVNFADYHPRGFISQVDAMQKLAERSGLVKAWGQDRVQRHLSQAFKGVRRKPQGQADGVRRPRAAAPSRHRCAQCGGRSGELGVYCDVRDIWLHPECNAAYVAALDGRPR